jgi:signal transduction histidine kinase
MEELVRLQELTRSQIQEMREFVRNLRPVEVDETGLEATVGRLVKTFERESGIQARFRGNGTSEIEDPEKSREVLKIIREGLHNAHKHSGASQVSVGLARSNGALEILIQDDGTGFPFAGRYSMEELDSLGLGPESIKRRVRALHGDMSVDSRPGMGADVRVLIPA